MKKGLLLLYFLVPVAAAGLCIPATAGAGAGGWKWEATLIAPAQGQALQLPSSLYVDEKRDRYYLADSAGNRLLSFSGKGDYLQAFSARGELKAPYDLVRDEDGVFWVVEKGRNSLTSIDLKAREVIPNTLSYQERELIPARLEYKDNSFYVLDRGSGGIARLNRDLAVKGWIRCPGCRGGFIDFKFSPEDEIWTLTGRDKRVVRFSSEGEQLGSFTVDDKVAFPVSLALGPAGNIYVLDRHEGRVAVFNSRGKFKYFFLSKGQSRGQLYYPIELSFDPRGRLVVVEEGNGRAEIFNR